MYSTYCMYMYGVYVQVSAYLALYTKKAGMLSLPFTVFIVSLRWHNQIPPDFCLLDYETGASAGLPYLTGTALQALIGIDGVSAAVHFTAHHLEDQLGGIGAAGMCQSLDVRKQLHFDAHIEALQRL